MEQQERDLSDRPSYLPPPPVGRSVLRCDAAGFPAEGNTDTDSRRGNERRGEGGGTRRRRRPHSERPTSNGGSKNISPSSRACACGKEPSDLGTTIIKV